jgi:hypothetical protein
LQYESLIHRLCHTANTKPWVYYGDNCEPISTLKEHYDWMAENSLFDNHFFSEVVKYPISSNDINNIVSNYATFYPIYDSYLQIAMGKPVRFLELVSKLNRWIRETNVRRQEQGEGDRASVLSEEELLQAREAAEQRIKVIPSLRWQVFQRDEWKCVACGRSSHHDIILHVDHIVPRSRGGQDTLDNFQTLCNVCNSGKSNKDTTDLRCNNSE